jgi:hypothetical protein
MFGEMIGEVWAGFLGVHGGGRSGLGLDRKGEDLPTLIYEHMYKKSNGSELFG